MQDGIPPQFTCTVNVIPGAINDTASVLDVPLVTVAGSDTDVLISLMDKFQNSVPCDTMYLSQMQLSVNGTFSHWPIQVCGSYSYTCAAGVSLIIGVPEWGQLQGTASTTLTGKQL